jgi:NAD+ synthase
MQDLNYIEVREKIAVFIRDKCTEAGRSKAVVGMSGGVDSSVTARLCADALGKENVIGVTMPDFDESREAEEFAASLGVEHVTLRISDVLDKLDTAKDKLGRGNLAARIRAAVLYYHSNTRKALVVGTSNKSERMIGYFTKYGDGAADILPLGDLYKTEVVELARSLGLPDSILSKAPSAGLWPGQTDEAELGMAYPELDQELRKIGKGEAANQKVKEMVDRSGHKRGMPPVCVIH